MGYKEREKKNVVFQEREEARETTREKKETNEIKESWARSFVRFFSIVLSSRGSAICYFNVVIVFILGTRALGKKKKKVFFFSRKELQKNAKTKKK